MYPANIGTISINAVSLNMMSIIKSKTKITALIKANKYFLVRKNDKKTFIPIITEKASEPMQCAKYCGYLL